MGNLLDGVYNQQIEHAVTRHIGRPYKICAVWKNEHSAMHETAIFSDGIRNVFVKLGTNPYSLDQFRQEAWGLEYIRSHSAVRTPEVIGVVQAEDEAVLLVMEAVEVRPVEKNSDWEVLGRGLAALHQATWDQCGLETHSYLGIFYQDNTPMESWAEFFGQRRLGDSMKMAVDAGNMTAEECKPVEELIRRLPVLVGPTQPNCLLHGDPWPGNLLFNGKEMVAIDCSLYYGNREIDLSTVDFFYPVSDYFFKAYHEVYPIDPGYPRRKALWQINQWLGHITLFGKQYIPKLMAAVKQYV